MSFWPFSPQHIPSSVPLQTVLPLLALCQYGLDLEVERELHSAPSAETHSSSQMSCIARITHHLTGSLGVERPRESGELSRRCGQLAAITASCYRLVSACGQCSMCCNRCCMLCWPAVCAVFPDLVAVVAEGRVGQTRAVMVVSLAASGKELRRRRKCSLLHCRHLRHPWSLCSW